MRKKRLKRREIKREGNKGNLEEEEELRKDLRELRVRRMR